MPESPDIFPIRTAWGLEYKVEAGNLPFKVVWELNSDLEAAAIFANGGISQVLSDVDEANVLDICDRSPQAIEQAYYIAGRSIVIPSVEQYWQISQTPYNAIQISGWGFNPIVDSSIGSFGETTQIVNLPRDNQNYRDIRPNATATTILKDGKMIKQARDYLFPGAYTEAEVIKKVGSELALWNLLTDNGINWDIPFHIPIPLLIGRYTGLADPKGKPAYFYASLVPYSGMRDGILLNRSQESIYSILDNSPRIGYALSELHKLGLAHNQAGVGNISTIYMKDGQIPLLADWGTATPLDLRPVRNPITRRAVRNYGRAHDLFSVLLHTLNLVNVPRDQTLIAVQMVLSDLLFNYGALSENNAYKLEESTIQMLRYPDHADFLIAQFLDDAEDDGILPRQPRIRSIQKQSVGQLNYWERRMQQIRRV